ncbi:MAG: 50S ribosomal protein L15 [Candidatus Pacebacteria bacterium]|nr:50S ribosomal protein L15 [Candidatus Paceibacterota bacterium]
MALELNNLKKPKRVKKSRKRIGRGNASGSGTYSGRGQKGQGARSGVSNLKRLGMKARLLQIPKSRGFKSLQPKNQVVSVAEINANYKEGEVVNPETLTAKDLVKRVDLPIKILGKESLNIKDLKFEKVKMSQSLQDQIKK